MQNNHIDWESNGVQAILENHDASKTHGRDTACRDEPSVQLLHELQAAIQSSLKRRSMDRMDQFQVSVQAVLAWDTDIEAQKIRHRMAAKNTKVGNRSQGTLAKV